MRKVLSVFGMLAAVAMIVMSIVLLTGTNDAERVKLDSVSPTRSTSSYDSGFASFGGDYYTYSVNNSYITANNAYEAARMSAFAANRIGVVTDQIAAQTRLIRTASGLSMLCFGLFGLFGFGIVLTQPGKAKRVPVGAYAAYGPSFQPAPTSTPIMPVQPSPVRQSGPSTPPDAAVLPQTKTPDAIEVPVAEEALSKTDVTGASPFSAFRPEERPQ